MDEKLEEYFNQSGSLGDSDDGAVCDDGGGLPACSLLFWDSFNSELSVSSDFTSWSGTLGVLAGEVSATAVRVTNAGLL